MSTQRIGKPVMRSGLRRLAAACVIAAVIVAVIVVQRTANPGAYVLRIPTDNASGVYSGSDVTIAGVNAGTVRSVTLGHGGEAVVTASLDPQFAPVHSDATAQIRPKSLLGEMYVAIDPGKSGTTLPSGARLAKLQVNRSTDLQQVFNSLDGPTRAKLGTLIDELGGGVTGRGGQLNQAIPSGTHDISDLASITATLNAKDTQLKAVISTLNTVTTELARSDRRQQLGALISSTDRLMGNLRAQQANLQQAVVQADHSLASLHQGLAGTAPALSGIAAALPTTVRDGSLLLTPLNSATNTLIPHMNQLVQGIQEGPVVFGGRDANGYATRISLSLGCGTVAVCPQLAGPLTGGSASGSSGSGGSGGGGTSPLGGAGPANGKGTRQGSSSSQNKNSSIIPFLLGGKP